MMRILMLLIVGGLPLQSVIASDLEKLTEEECRNYPSLMPKGGTAEDRSGAIDASSALAKGSLLRYLSYRDSVFSEYYQGLKLKSIKDPSVRFNPQVENIRNSIVGEVQQKFIREFSKNLEEADSAIVKKYWKNDSPYKAFIAKSSGCLIKDIAESQSSGFNEILQSFVELARTKVTTGQIGYFNVKVNSCSVTDGPITGNSYTEPKSWPGSRFVVIDAEFKNLDQEGRLPSEGSLIINHNGKELNYDSTESIMQEGYGIYFKSVNPLITMPTKIVYRIPNEVSGEVSWEPGRNPDDRKLWCTFVAAEQ